MDRKYDLSNFWGNEEVEEEDMTPNVPAVTKDDSKADNDPAEILYDDSVFVDDESDPDE
jgi:hypothetical protein